MATVRATEQRLRELEQQVDELAADLRTLRALIEQDHASALNKIRYVTEKILHELCIKHEVALAREPTVESMLAPLVANKIIPKHISLHVRTIQANANFGSHYQDSPATATHVHVAQIAMIEFLEWHYRDDPRASLSMPSRSQRRGRGRQHLLGGVAVGIGIAAVIVSYVVLRTRDRSLRDPRAGFDAVARFERPSGSGIVSEDMWRTAVDDFASAAAQSGAPLRYRAGERFARGMVSTVRGSSEEAVGLLREAISIDPAWAAPHGALANALSRLEEFDEALSQAREASRLEPESWRWIAIGAHIHLAAGTHDSAISEYRRALDKAPSEPILLGDFALALHVAHRDGEAVRIARDVLTRDEGLVSPRIVLAEHALEKGDGKTAIEEATRALAVAPRSVSARLALAYGFTLTGDSAALPTFRRSVDEWQRQNAGRKPSDPKIIVAMQIASDGNLELARGRYKQDELSRRRERSLEHDDEKDGRFDRKHEEKK